VSNGASETYDVDGNITDTSLILEGKLSTQQDSNTGTGTTDVSKTINVDGSLSPTSESVTLTGSGSSFTYNPAVDDGSGSVGTRHRLAEDGVSIEMIVDPPQSGVADSIDVRLDTISNSDPSNVNEVDIYFNAGETSADSNFTDGTKIKTWNPTVDSTDGNSYITINTSEFDVPSGKSTISFVTTSANNGTIWFSSSDEFDAPIIKDDRGGTVGNLAGYPFIEINPINNPKNVEVDIEGIKTSFGDFTDGESKTNNVVLKLGDNSFSITADGGDSVDYTINYEERTETIDPSIEIDSPDGTQTVSHTGTIADGSTVDLTADIDESLIGGGTVTINPTISDSVTGATGKANIEHRVTKDALTSPPNRDVSLDVAVSGDVDLELLAGANQATATHQTKDLGFVPVEVTLNDDVIGDDSAVSYTIEDGNGNTVNVSRSDVDTIVDCSNFTSSTITVTANITDLQTDLLEWGAYFQ